MESFEGEKKYFTLETIDAIKEEFERQLYPFTVQKNRISDFEEAWVLNDSMVLFLQTIESRVSCIGPDYNRTIYSLYIEEVMPDEIDLKFNIKNFIIHMKSYLGLGEDAYLGIMPSISSGIEYKKFRGFSRIYWCPDEPSTAEYVANALPQLQMTERWKAYQGQKYNFVIVEMTAPDGSVQSQIGFTTGQPHSFIINLGKHYIKYGSLPSNFGGYAWNDANHISLNLWKGEKRQYRLENHLKYYYIERFCREKREVYNSAREIINIARNTDTYKNIERGTYLRPTYRWVNEELTLKLVKKIYKGYKVIHQFRPFFLRSSYGGQMSYDIFVPALNVAIEYQGKQHFESVDYFGGEESLAKTQKRDAEKKKLSDEHGITLVYFYYNDVLTEDLIRKRIEEALQ